MCFGLIGAMTWVVGEFWHRSRDRSKQGNRLDKDDATRCPNNGLPGTGIFWCRINLSQWTGKKCHAVSLYELGFIRCITLHDCTLAGRNRFHVVTHRFFSYSRDLKDVELELGRFSCHAGDQVG